MLRALALTAQSLILALAAYNGTIALWGWRDQAFAPPGPRSRRLRVVVPAHDEEAVIGGLLCDLAASDYPTEAIEVWVVADHCSDGTAALARNAGVHVAERKEGARGKGAALAWHLGERPLGAEEILVVFDADNRVSRGTLGRIADEIDAGAEVAQCYLDVTNPDRSSVALSAALSYWAGNRMVQLARANLGWSPDLGGTGMAFSESALERVGGFRHSLTEDRDLAVRLALHDVTVGWLHDARVYDEKPTRLGSAVRQRARWMAGRRSVRRTHLHRLLRKGFTEGSLPSLDLALRLVQPGRSFVALLSAVFTAGALITRSDWLLPLPLWAAATVVQLIEPIPFLVRDRVPARYVLRYPLLVLLGVLWVPIRIVSSRVRSWERTPHSGVRHDGTTN